MSTTLSKYDKKSADSILAYARKLLGKSIHSLYPNIKAAKSGNKGGLGQIVEKVHFGYKNNNDRLPDFPEAGVELKCTPLKTLGDGSMVSKERLVLNIIDFMDEGGKTFEASSFLKKNALLLLMFYLHIAGTSNLDFIFRIIRLWSIPKEDLRIFKDDWAVIQDKIKNGLAHELHEGDTFYLATCTKGEKKGKNLRRQPASGIKAPQRAYSIKSAYLNQIILDSLMHPEMVSGMKMTEKQRRVIENKQAEYGKIVRDVSQYNGGETFKDYVYRHFSPYIGKTIREIEHILSVSVPDSPKSMAYALCRAILGVKERRVAEFEKAGVLLKTIRLEESGGLKEAMSFSQLRYKEIYNENKWEDSAWYNIVTQRFFFVVFRKKKQGDDKDAVLENVFFWAIPARDLCKCRKMWEDTRWKVRHNDYTHFIKQSEGSVCHIRPKARNAADQMETPQGGKARKLCYWFNRGYVLHKILKSHGAREWV